MTIVSWKQTGGSGNWSTASNWTPAPPASGDSVVIGTTRNTAPIVVTDNVPTAVQTLTLAARAAARTELVVLPADGLTVNGGVVIGPYSSIDGSGTLIANGAISGTGTIVADGGLLDLAGSGSIASGGPVLSIGSTIPSTLEVNLPGGASARVLAINNVNQTLEVGPAGTLTLTTALNVSNGSVLMAGGSLSGKGISFGSLLTNGSLSGFGTVTANLSRSGTGSADMITAVGGTLDLEGRVNAGLVLAIGDSAPADLKIGSAAQSSTAIAISSAKQTLEIGAAGSLKIAAGETITNGTIQLDGGSLSDSNGLGIGAGATLTGTGTVSAGSISGAGTVIASGGVLNLKSALSAAGTHFIIGPTSGSVLELSNSASGSTFTFAGAAGTLELADIGSGVVRGFSSTIAGLKVGASGAVPTNDIDIQAPVTSATLSGNQIKVLNGTKTVATLLLNAAPAAGARAFVQADHTLGGYDVFLASPASPTVSWSPTSVTGTESSPLALGTITALAGGAPLASVLVGNIPVSATLADGAGHSFLASASTTSVNVLGWSYGNLTLAAPNDSNVSLSVQASDTLGDSSAFASEALAIDPLAPTVAPAAVSGSTGQPIALNLGIIVNKMAGDTNSLSSVTLTGIPVGATLSNSAGALTPSGGVISFNAAQLAAGALGGLAINSPTPGPIALGMTAMEQDANGDVSATAAGSESVTVQPPAPSVTWSSPPGAAAVGVEGEVIGLGTITPAGSGLTAVTISGLPVNATVSDGTHSFAATGVTTSVNILGWNYGSLTITPANDANFVLSAQVTDGFGQTSVAANQAVTVDPEAPTVSPIAASGAIGRAIALNLELAVNGMSGDTNGLSSVTIGGIPAGATLGDSSGTLAVFNGSITFSAGQLAAGVLNGLAITPASGGTFSLNVSATEQDGNGDSSTTTVGQAVITAAGGRVIDTSVTGPIALAAGDNPVTITSTGTVTSVGAGQDGIDGSAGTAWNVANSGTVVSSAAVGISLSGSGTIASAGLIAGNTGIILRGGGAISNAAAGSISASGTVGGGFAVGAGIYITGALGTATNYGAITGGGYGIAMAAGGSVTNLATITGGEDAVIVTNAAGTLDNQGRLVATVDDGVGLFAGGSVSNAAGAFISGAGTLGAGVFITGGTGTVSNAGSIEGLNHIGILIASGGTITNATSGTISGSDSGVFFELQPGTLRNAGTISSSGPNGAGVYLENAGAVTNLAGGVISGAKFGAFVEGGFSTVENYGSISGGTYDGVVVGMGGSVTNAAGGLISGGSGGVYVKYRAAGTVTNFGSINGASGAGIDLADGGTVDNGAGAAVTGSNFGVFITGASGVVTNSGSIGAAKYDGVELVAGGTLTNASDGVISGGSNGVYVEAGGTVVNSGFITAKSASGAGASLFGGSLSNSAGAAISGASFGVFVTGASGTITNAGTLTGSHGVALEAGGTLSNAASGVIAGQVSGVFSQGGAATVANYGSISAGASGGAGADIEAGGTINNFASAAITGTSFGVFVTGGVGSVSNAGTISASSNIGVQLSDGGSVDNVAGASISGAGYGIVIDGGGTVTNAGTISGTPAAVKFSGAGNDRVVAQPGAVFNGAVVGGAGTNTLELAAGSGSISMAPGLFNGFGTVEADGGSNWTLTNADSTASELFQLDSASTLDVTAALGTNAQFSFLGGSDLVVTDTSTFGTAVGSSAYAGPLLEDFGAADAIDLPNFSAVGAMATLSSGTGLLQLSNGSSQAASLSFQTSSLGSGTFQLGPDHSGGIILTLS